MFTWQDTTRKFADVILNHRIRWPEAVRRKSNNHLNLEVDEIETIDDDMKKSFESMNDTKVLFICINVSENGELRLLEQWHITCGKTSEYDDADISQLSVLMRSLYTTLLLLPANELYHRGRKLTFNISNVENRTSVDQDFTRAVLNAKAYNANIVVQYRTNVTKFLRAPYRSLSDHINHDYLSSTEATRVMKRMQVDTAKFNDKIDQSMSVGIKGSQSFHTVQDMSVEFAQIRQRADLVLL
ncbi:autophagy-related protein 13 [Acrasis kona]|uniref:Autophagy-related protein 13 n=1 Tax=Acrasis kona TaxID=1008807 RepID=A0AAW2Z8L6_9EUKA